MLGVVLLGLSVAGRGDRTEQVWTATEPLRPANGRGKRLAVAKHRV